MIVTFLPSCRYWDIRQPNLLHTQQLSDRCYALAVRYPLMVVGTADSNLTVFNLPQVLSSRFICDDQNTFLK